MILFSTSLGGCKPDLKEKVSGVYSIDLLMFNGQDITNELGVNVVSFEKNGICRLPGMRITSEIKANQEMGTWELNSMDTTLTIVADHFVFAGTYEISFDKDFEEKLLKINLRSDETNIIASKGLQDFDSHRDSW